MSCQLHQCVFHRNRWLWWCASVLVSTLRQQDGCSQVVILKPRTLTCPQIKNELTNIAGAMRHISCAHTLLLTGTPLQNNLHELYALLDFLQPGLFTDPTIFDDAFDLTHHKVGGRSVPCNPCRL